MQELLDQAIKGLVASGPLALMLIYALRHQTQRLAEAENDLKKCIKDCEEKIEQLHDEKEALYEKVLETMREVTRD